MIWSVMIHKNVLLKDLIVKNQMTSLIQYDSIPFSCWYVLRVQYISFNIDRHMAIFIILTWVKEDKEHGCISKNLLRPPILISDKRI